MPVELGNKAGMFLQNRQWARVRAFYAGCQHVALVKHGVALESGLDHRRFPAVSDADWMAVSQYELFDALRDGTSLDALDGRHKQVLWFITLAAEGTETEFASALHADRVGYGEDMRMLRAEWARARHAPQPRARIGETPEALLARLNNVSTVTQAYKLGSDDLRSGRFADNIRQVFLLPYALLRHRAENKARRVAWTQAPCFSDLAKPEKRALEVMFHGLSAPDQFAQTHPELAVQPSHEVAQFRIAVAELATQSDVTPDLPTGGLHPQGPSGLNPFDAALSLFDSALNAGRLM